MPTRHKLLKKLLEIMIDGWMILGEANTDALHKCMPGKNIEFESVKNK